VTSKKSRLASLVRLATWAVAAAALVEQLRRPQAERTWHGRVGGIVPYDFRVPTLARIRSAMWNPDDDRIVTEQPFGVGWTVNVARLLEVFRAR
jgi:cytochrome b